MGSKVKELVDATAATMDELARKTNLSSAFGEHTPGQLITMELMMFAMYMSASDGEIQKEEAEHIAEVFGLPFTPAMIGETIRKFDIYSKTFETKVPVSMQIFVAIDNALHEKGLNGSNKWAQRAWRKPKKKQNRALMPDFTAEKSENWRYPQFSVEPLHIGRGWG